MEKFLRALTGDLTPAPRSTATYSRRFSELGRYAGRDWARIAVLTHALSDPASPPERDRSRLNSWCRKYLGRSFGSARVNVGWEWSVLTRGGYVPRDAGGH